MMLRSDVARMNKAFELRFWSSTMITKFVTSPPPLHREGFGLWHSTDRIFLTDDAGIYS